VFLSLHRDECFAQLADARGRRHRDIGGIAPPRVSSVSALISIHGPVPAPDAAALANRARFIWHFA